MYEAGGHWFETLSEYLEYRVTTLELLVDRQRDRVSSSFKNHLKRIESLESERKDIQFLIQASNQHKKRIEKIENYHQVSWAKKTTYHLEPKPHTCGECQRPWRKESDGGMVYMLACRHNKKPDKEVSWRCEDDEACGKFKSREESCT